MLKSLLHKHGTEKPEIANFLQIIPDSQQMGSPTDNNVSRLQTQLNAANFENARLESELQELKLQAQLNAANSEKARLESELQELKLQAQSPVKPAKRFDQFLEPVATLTEAAPEKASSTDSSRGDWAAIGLLMLLYTLQGVPMGLGGSIPFLMQAKGISLTEQAKFSVIAWPFSLKLLWAPLVDSVYSSTLGRRKTWIVPVQASIGALLLWSSGRIDGWLGEGGGEPDVATLTSLFLLFYFLAATQDIAVDGLALTILSPRNRELGATCNAIGQSVGYFLAYTGFLAFYSPDFCNTYLRSAASQSEVGMFTLGGFMAFWAWVFLGSTLWVAVAKGDEHTPLCGSPWSIVTSAYGEMVGVSRLPAVRSTALLLFTCRAALGVFDSATPLKMVEAGMPKEHLALMSSLLFPVGLLSQLYISGRYLAGGSESTPLLLWGSCYPLRLLLGLCSLPIIYLVSAARTDAGAVPSWLYAAILIAAMAASMVSQTMFVAQMAFYNRVSDPAIGGTYMTMLNTISNLGAAWPSTAALFLVDLTTVKECTSKFCSSGADCGCDPTTLVDGFYITGVGCLLLGVAWYAMFRKRIAALQSLPASAWLICEHTGASKKTA